MTLEFTKLRHDVESFGESNVVVAGDDYAWVLSLTGHEQPKNSYYHRTILKGGKVARFNVGSKTWDTPVEFPAIDEDENREDFHFAIANTLMLVVYSRYEEFNIHKLMKWVDEDKAWKDIPYTVSDNLKQKSFRMDVSLYHAPGSKTVDFLGSFDSGSGCFYGNINITPDGARAEKLGSVTLPPQSLVMGLIRHEDVLYAAVGMHGCGVRWESNRLLRIPLNGEESQYAEVSGDGPRYSYGPSNSAVAGGGWLVLGGSVQVGMSNSEWRPGVWSLDLGRLAWAASPMGEMPPGMDGGTTDQAPDGTIFAYAQGHGLFAAKLN